MLVRSLGASTFAGFWRYWNPIFGYYLGRYVFEPARRWMPRPPAVVLTFVACGALHDLVTMAVRGSVTLLFTPWFFLMSLGLLGGSAFGLNFGDRPWWMRAVINLGYVAACLVLTVVARRLLAIP
jgi:hypothetical protein